MENTNRIICSVCISGQAASSSHWLTVVSVWNLRQKLANPDSSTSGGLPLKQLDKLEQQHPRVSHTAFLLAWRRLVSYSALHCTCQFSWTLKVWTSQIQKERKKKKSNGPSVWTRGHICLGPRCHWEDEISQCRVRNNPDLPAQRRRSWDSNLWHGTSAWRLSLARLLMSHSQFTTVLG